MGRGGARPQRYWVQGLHDVSGRKSFKILCNKVSLTRFFVSFGFRNVKRVLQG